MQIYPSILVPVFFFFLHSTPFFSALTLLPTSPSFSNQFNSQLWISRSILSGSASQRDHHQFFTTFQRRLSLQTRCQIAYSGTWMSVTAPNRRQHPTLWLSTRDADPQQQLSHSFFLVIMYIRTCFYFHCPSLFSFHYDLYENRGHETHIPGMSVPGKKSKITWNSMQNICGEV